MGFKSLWAAAAIGFGGRGVVGGRGLNWCLLGWVESLELVVSESVESVESVVSGLDSMVAGLASMVVGLV